MRDYGKVRPRFWTDGTGKKLRGDRDAQLVALYLVTSPHATMLGIFYLPAAYVAHETGLPEADVGAALERLEREGFLLYDRSAELVFVVNMARDQVGESLKPNDKRVAGIRTALDKVGNERFRSAFVERYGEVFHLEDTPKPLRSPFGAPCKPHRSQDQDQEQEQEHLSLERESVEGEIRKALRWHGAPSIVAEVVADLEAAGVTEERIRSELAIRKPGSLVGVLPYDFRNRLIRSQRPGSKGNPIPEARPKTLPELAADAGLELHDYVDLHRIPPERWDDETRAAMDAEKGAA